MESASSGFAGHPVVAALDAVSDALDKAATADVWSLPDDDLSATTEWCERLAARQAALALRLVREVDARDLGRRQGAPSTAAWLAGRLRLRPGEAKTRVELANRLDPHAPDGPVDYAANVAAPAVGALPATAAALAVGTVSVDHACVVAKTMTALPAGVGIEQARVAESDLAGYAAQFDPATVGRLGRYLIHLLDSDTMEEREQRAYRRRELRMVDLGDGLTRLSGQLDTESADRHPEFLPLPGSTPTGHLDPTPGPRYNQDRPGP